MKKIFACTLYLFVSNLLFSQEIIGKIAPNEKFQNPYDFNLFYMPRAKVIEFKNLATMSEFDSLKMILYKEKLKTYEERMFLADSASNLKKLEADYWHEKLQSNDALLESEKKTTVELRADIQRIRQSRIYYFIGGVVATSVAVGMLNN